MPNSSYPPPAAPVERWLWAALLEDRRVDVPCHFVSSPAWGCNEADEWHNRCPDLPAGATAEQRARHSVEHASTSVACVGMAAGIAALMVYGGGYIPACPAHMDWLRHHVWLDGMTAGVLLRREGGVGPWHAVGWPGVAQEIAQWRVVLPAWERIDASSRTAVSAASMHLPRGVSHSPDWGYQLAQLKARKTNGR